MITRQPFGRTGHASTRTIFDAAALAQATPAEADRTLDLLLQYGVNHINLPVDCGDAERHLRTWMSRYRDQFFLATTIRPRFRDEARAALTRTLERLRVDYVDLLQLDNLVDQDEWGAAMDIGGALAAAVAAREQGQVRFLGVTGPGPQAPLMHMRSLDRYPFESVLLPYNYPELQHPEYRAGMEDLLDICAAFNVAVQTSGAIARRPWAGAGPAAGYEPLTDPAAIDLAVWWVLGEDSLFLLTPADLALLPLVLDAAARLPPEVDGPSAAQMDQLVAAHGMAALVPGA